MVTELIVAILIVAYPKPAYVIQLIGSLAGL